MSISRKGLVLGTIGVLVCGAAGFVANEKGVFTQEKTRTPVQNTLISQATATTDTQVDSNQVASTYVTGDQTLGDVNAPVKIIEYASLTCPHCGSFHKNTFPELERDYIDTGKVHFTMREVYFDRFGLWATIVARCGTPSQYYPFIDLFMKSQDRWLSAEDPVVAIREIGRMGGLSQERIEACLQDETFAKQLLERYQRQSQEDDIQSTPSFIINGKKIAGDRSIEELRDIIDPLIEK